MFVTIATASATPMNPHHRGAYAFHHHREEDPPGRRAELWVPSELADEAFTAAGRERALDGRDRHNEDVLGPTGLDGHRGRMPVETLISDGTLHVVLVVELVPG
jgi:hypothetical protein